MAGRYLITGVQIGMLKSMIKIGEKKLSNKQLDDIIKDQFVGNSKNSIKEDIRKWKEKTWETDKP